MTEATVLSAGARLQFTGNALPLFGRWLFATLASLLVIPAPWMAAWFGRWFVDQTEADDGTEMAFEGQGGEIWLPAMLLMLLTWAGNAPWPLTPGLETSVPLLLIPIHVLLYLFVLRWVATGMRLNGDRVTFVGSYWPFLGYNLLYLVSIVTIIGWAWVLAAWLRWQCRNVEGEATFAFHGRGHEVLWRCVVAIPACILVIPIPWMMRWLTRWFMSQVSVDHGAQPAATATASVEETV